MKRYLNRDIYKEIDDGVVDSSETQANFEKLVVLLEETSKKLEIIRKCREKEQNRLLLGVVIIYGAFPFILFAEKTKMFDIDRIYFKFGMLGIGMIFIIHLLIQVTKIKELKLRIREEVEMLQRIVYLTYEYKENISTYKSSIIMTLLELRIQRVEYNLRKNRNNMIGRILNLFI